MASIARWTLMNLFDCIRCFFLRGIHLPTSGCAPFVLSEQKRYIQVADTFAKPQNVAFEGQTTNCLLNESQSIQEVQQTAAVAISAAFLTLTMGTIHLKSPFGMAAVGFQIDIPVQSLKHIEPGDSCDREVQPCSVINSTLKFFDVKNIGCVKSETKPWSENTTKFERVEPKENNAFKTRFGDEDLTIWSDVPNVQLSRSRSVSESSDDKFICFIEDELNSYSSRNYGYSNKCDFEEYTLSSSKASKNGEKEASMASSGKKVRFDLSPKVHILHTWNFAYRTARKGDWENFARDRVRFHNRIQRAAEYVDPVLDPLHRQKIYNTRFYHELRQLPPTSLDTPF